MGQTDEPFHKDKSGPSAKTSLLNALCCSRCELHETSHSKLHGSVYLALCLQPAWDDSWLPVKTDALSHLPQVWKGDKNEAAVRRPRVLQTSDETFAAPL